MSKKSEWDKLLNPNIFKRIKLRCEWSAINFFIWRDIKFGFVAPDGEPLKCFKCNSKDMEEYGQYYEDYHTIEYSVRCKECGQKLGSWAYGNWSI